MNDRLRHLWSVLKTPMRSYLTGAAVVDPWRQNFWGMSEFQPPEYVEYLAKSNGVYACARKRAQLLAELPLKLYTVDSNGDKEEVTSGDAFALLQKVNPYWTLNRLIEMTELSLCVWGEAFWFLERGSKTGTPKEIWWARADRVKVIPHPTNYVDRFEYRPKNGGDPLIFTPEQTVWLRFPNPIDEFEGLSPLAAARISADTANAAMQSNFNLFRNGIQMGGIVTPNGDTSFTLEEAQTLSSDLDKRFKGVDKAHRWAVLAFDAKFQSMSLSPKDAEFLGALKWSLEDICRAYDVPQDLVGGQRTYENVDAAMRMVYTHAVLPEARFIGTEITEQLLPLFGIPNMLAEFDSSHIAVLQEDKAIQWQITSDKIAKGVVTINEVRDEEGLDPLPWGDSWWLPLTMAPIHGDTAAELPAPTTTTPAGEGEPPPEPTSPRAARRAVTFGSPEHERLHRLFTRRTEPWERKVDEVTTDLLQRQRTAVLARLQGRTARAAENVADEPFDKPRWIKAFRTAMRPVLRLMVHDSGQTAMDDLALATAFDVSDPNVLRFIEGRAQRFAVEVNATTYDNLKASLSEGVANGESIDKLALRVDEVMGDRIQSSATTIARTEVIGASNGGTQLSWEQSGVVKGKTWLAALDERTRETHIEAHGQTVGLDEDFDVGDGSGPAPGQIGIAEEDINCRCSMTAELEDAPRIVSTNGHGQTDMLALVRLAEALQ